MSVLQLSLVPFIYKFISFVAFVRLGCTQELLQLTEQTFDRVVNESSFAFVIFYAPWNKHSLEAINSINQAMNKLDMSDNHIIVGKVNAYDEIKLATRFWIDHWPMFKFFLKGSVTPETYRGGTKPEDFASFIYVAAKKRIDPSMYRQRIIELDNSNFERVTHNTKKNVFVLFYTTWCEACKPLLDTLSKVGENFQNEKDCVVAKLDGDVNYAVALQQEIPRYPAIKVYSLKNKDGYIYYPGKFQENWSEENITKFLNLQCKTKCTVMGRLDETAGRIEELDRLVKVFMENSFKRQQVLEEARYLRRTHSDQLADFYLNTMQKIMKEGTEFLTVELNRTERLLRAAIHADRADELQKRRNILRQFAIVHHEKDEL